MELVKIDSRVAMETPAQVVFERDGVKVTRCLIPQTYTEAGVLFFVDRDNGDSFGSYPNKQAAIEAAKLHRALPQ